MAGLVLEKLKTENELLANQVGMKVKDEALTELKSLKEKVSELEKERDELAQVRDTLKNDIVKEKEQMKKEHEKERLKRVTDFEEKNELIAKLQGENDRLQKRIKEKEKIAKKAEGKVKSHADQVAKMEEEHKAKVKEMKKQLDKAKGDLLVKKSKKRLQDSSVRNREATRLISHHDSSNRHYKLPKHEPYVEGDE